MASRIDAVIQETHADVLEAGRILGKHPEVVKRMIRTGKIKAELYGPGRGKWYIEREELERIAGGGK